MEEGNGGVEDLGRDRKAGARVNRKIEDGVKTGMTDWIIVT